jgi:hypothetical protein
MDCWRHEGVRGIMRPSVHACLGRAGRRRVRHLRWGMAPVWLVLAVAIALPAPTPARAQSLNCSDFTYQEDAQANLNAFPSDPNGLMMTTTVSPAKTCHPDPATSPVRRLRRS